MTRKLDKSEHGQALVEMALVLPLLLLLLFGVIEMARVGYAYISISNAAREGGRVATIGGTDLEIKNSVINATPLLDSAVMVITIYPIEADRRSGQTVTVNVKYSVNLLAPIIDMIPNPIEVSTSIIMRQE
ncbi:hypothetical protein DP73_09295 [Desulfosporosinus sp. HMP52]|uniref:TadE/TadG family type IV pilus assembly protein n=1 Tax=Desulfosporosinus sp. HMP52 TaxID=1487923 RepID=UPI00051FDAC3|nr:TadE/TadG family type IV pilus assembly protein [Desulfosporosinus sp. HMP52]KGK89817.1 hypothetical protein DP73_09295 [Desulfosporosinus sp. HMP52]